MLRQAEDIVRNVRERDSEAEARAIYDWVDSHGRFTRSMRQRVKTAGYQIDEITERGKVAGYCTDATVLIGALAGSIGLNIRTVILKDSATWYHIYPEALLGKWVTMDIVGNNASFGRAIPGEKIIVEPKGEKNMMGDIQVSPTVKVDAQGNVFMLQDVYEGMGASKKMKKLWKKVGKVVQKVGKVVLPVTGIVATTLWAKGAIDRAAKKAADTKKRIADAKARGNAIIIDSAGREIEVPTAAATSTMVTAAQQEASMTTPEEDKAMDEQVRKQRGEPEERQRGARDEGEKKKDNTMLYVGGAALALLLFSGMKKGA